MTWVQRAIGVPYAVVAEPACGCYFDRYAMFCENIANASTPTAMPPSLLSLPFLPSLHSLTHSHASLVLAFFLSFSLSFARLLARSLWVAGGAGGGRVSSVMGHWDKDQQVLLAAYR